MSCAEYLRLAEASENRRKAYAYIRLSESKVRISKMRYEELVKEGYAAMISAFKELRWHELNCSVCKNVQPME
jgi:hypothetical protein